MGFNDEGDELFDFFLLNNYGDDCCGANCC